MLSDKDGNFEAIHELWKNEKRRTKIQKLRKLDDWVWNRGDSVKRSGHCFSFINSILIRDHLLIQHALIARICLIIIFVIAFFSIVYNTVSTKRTYWRHPWTYITIFNLAKITPIFVHQVSVITIFSNINDPVPANNRTYWNCSRAFKVFLNFTIFASIGSYEISILACFIPS